MMKIETIVGDVVLLLLQEVESLKEMGIQKNKIYARIVGYDENGIWIEHPNLEELLKLELWAAEFVRNAVEA